MQPQSTEEPRTGNVFTRSIVCIGWVIASSCLVYSAIFQAPVNDEFGHFYAGLRYWQYGDTNIFKVNSPLIRGIATLPAYGAGMRDHCEEDDSGMGAADRVEFPRGRDLFIGNPQRFQFWLTVGRMGIALTTLFGGWLLFRWATELGGHGAGILAAGLWFAQPQILSHGVLITGDVVCGVSMLCSLRVLVWAVDNLNWQRATALGAMLGLSVLVKFTALVLLPVALLLMAWQADRYELRRLLGLSFVILAVMIIVLGLPYSYAGFGKSLPEYPFLSGSFHELQATAASFADRVGLGKNWIVVPLPEHLVLGLDRQQLDFELGLPSYAAGLRSSHGWWWFYLYSMFVKLPTGTLFSLGTAVAVLMVAPIQEIWSSGRRLASLSTRKKDGLLSGLGPAMGLLLAVLFATSMQDGFAQQHRYVLPAYPPMFLIASVTIARSSACVQYLGMLGFATSLLGCVVSGPHWLGAFNIFAGGNTTGYRCLFNDASDWGQDSYRVRDWCEDHASTKIYIHSTFSGHRELQSVGAGFEALPIDFTQLELPCWLVVSKSDLAMNSWLSRALEDYSPVDYVGSSHIVYRLPRQMGPTPHSAEVGFAVVAESMQDACSE